MQRKSKTIPAALNNSEVITNIVASVQKKFGSDSIAVLTDSSEFATAKSFISFGHWGLDHIVSGLCKNGGVPEGRLTEIYGSFSSGKSLLISHLLASCQKQGGIAILDDTEHAYIKEFGEMIGVNNGTLIYSASETVEEVFDKMEMILKPLIEAYPTTPIVYAWDSLALVQSSKESETAMTDTGGYNTERAKAIHQGSRKLVSLIGKSRVALVIANQTRQKLGVMFGEQETTSGGDAIPFWASVRIKLARKELLRINSSKDSEVIGVRGMATVKKNKISKPFQSCEFDIYFDKGVSWSSGSVDLLIKKGLLIEDTKGIYVMKGEKKKRSEWEKHFMATPTLLEELQ